MKKEYEIKHEPVEVGGQTVDKYNVYYYHDDELVGKEFLSYDGSGEVREGYKLKNSPDWLNLEQTLRYFNNASLFTKAFTEASDKGLNLFMITLINGKSGVASQAALAYAFNTLGVDENGYPAPLNWTNTEKAQINQILADSKFSITI